MFVFSSAFTSASGMKQRLKFTALISMLALVLGLGVVTGTQAAVTVQGTFTGLSVADVKGYLRNTANVTVTMTTATAFSTNTSNVIELERGGGSAFSAFTTNGSSNNCTIGCDYGDSQLTGFTFSITDSSNNLIPTTDTKFFIYDTMVRVTFLGNSVQTVPAGSTIKFEFAPNKVTASPLSTDTVRTKNVDTATVLDQTATYNWFKRIIFQGNGASVSSLVFEGKDFVLSTDANPSSTLPSYVYRAGYNITGWNTSADGTGTAYALGAAFNYPAQSTNLYAQWAVAPKIVTFNANGGSGSLAQQFSATATTLTLNNNNITKAGFAFNGWNTLANGTGTAYANGASFPFSANATLYAQWGVAAKTVTFDANGGTGSIAAQSSGAAANLTSNANSITREGYSFSGWNTAANGSGTAYANSASFPFTANTTLYAQWTANSNAVIYDSHGGSAVADGSFATGGNIATLPAAPTRLGYTFKGWFASASGGSALSDGYAPGTTSAITLHAQWTGSTNSVTYDSHGGSAVADGSFVTDGTIAALPAAPTREGYTFNGWFAAATGGSALSDGYAPGVSTGITLHAQWTGKTNVITYDSHGGSAVADGSFVTGGTVAALPAAPTREGYTFDGWFAAASGGSALSDGYAPGTTSGITLHAQWTGKTNVITYNSHGGSAVANGSFVTGETVANLPAAPTRAGFTFQGWFLAETGGTALNSGYVSGYTSGITLHAQWVASSFSVTFEANGGSGTMAAQSEGAPAKLDLNKFTKDGFYFDHWNTQADDSGTEYANTATFAFTADTTLYAQWREIPEVVEAKVEFKVPVGSSIDNAPVALTADGLLDQSGYTVTVFSTPQIIDRGTIWSGRLNTTVRIPAGLEGGWHRLVITGTAADGTPWVETNYFEVSPTGLLLTKSEAAPQQLADTGVNLFDGLLAGSFFVFLGSLALGLSALKTRRRRVE
jgi:uncharacterized repeat protein (TIGR02543 family)